MSRFDRFDDEAGKRKGVIARLTGATTPAASPGETEAERRKAYLARSGAVPSRVNAILTPQGKFALLLDGTGSMSGLIDQAKASIGDIIRRVLETRSAKAEMRLFVYRDYDVPDQLLERSEVSSDSAPLTAWLTRIAATGGGGNGGEAIEAALAAVLAEGGYSAVLLAGDEPPNPLADVVAGGGKATAQDLAARLGERGIPVHSFVVGRRNETISAFHEIARLSGGQLGFMDSSEEMIHMAVMAMLSSLKGAASVQTYLSGNTVPKNAADFGRLLLGSPADKKR
jgi:hypothetical protein